MEWVQVEHRRGCGAGLSQELRVGPHVQDTQSVFTGLVPLSVEERKLRPVPGTDSLPRKARGHRPHP